MAQTQQQKMPKGLPKRTRNQVRKGKRPISVARGKERRLQHDLENSERAKANRKRRANGEPTPWEVAKGKRLTRRVPKREAWKRAEAQRKHESLLAND